MSLHILDRYTDKIKDFLTNKTDKKVVLDDLHTRNIESHTETYDFTVDYTASENIQPRDRVLIPDEEIGQYREFVVDDIEIDTYDGETQIKTVASHLEDLEKGRPIEPDKLDQYTTEQAVEYALTHVDWELGTIEYGGFRTISWTGVNSPFGILKIIANRFDLQLDFTIEIDGNEISRRLVHLREKTALFDGKEVRRGKDLENLKIQKSSTDVVTALLALAPEPEEGEDRITLVVTDDEAQAQYGRERDYIWGVYEPQSDDGGMTETRLRTLATTELNKRKQPKTDYSIDAVDLEKFLGHEKVRIGDKIRIKDDLQEPLFYADATVKEVKRSVFNFLSKSYVLGDVTEYTREDITKIFEQFRALLARRMTETQSNLDNIVTIIDTAVERRIFKQPNPPENPINSQLWLNTSNPDKPVLIEYFNGQWIVRISAVTDPEDIGAISRAEAMYEAILAALESFEVLHMQILTEANQIKLNKYLNQSNKDILDNRILAVVNSYNKLKAEIAKHKDTKAITLDEANHIQLLMLAYTDSIKALKEAIITATNYAMEHLAILQSQYSDEKYTEALEEVAGKFGMTVEDGKLIGDTVLLEDLTNTKTELQTQLDAAKETLLALESANTSNETSITTITQEITNLEGIIASKVSQSDYDLLDKTVTDMGTEVSQTAEAVSTKAEKSYVDTVKGTVENHALSITEHAEGIDTLISKTNTHDGQITDVTNTANQTAEGLAQTITKVTEAEGAITQAQADIVANTTEISNKLSSADYTLDQENIVQQLNMADSERTQLASEIQDRVTLADYKVDKDANAGALNTLETSITQNGKDIALRATKEELDGVDKTLKASHAELKIAHDNITSEVAGLSDNLTEVSTTVTQNKDAFDVSIEENTTKFSQIDDNLIEKVGKSEIVTSINASTEGVKIKGDLVEITAGSQINLAIQGAKDYADDIASNAEQSAKDYAQTELNKAKNEDLVQKNKVITEINLDESGAQIKGDRIELTAGSSIRLAINKAEKAGTDAQSTIGNLDVGSENLLPDSGWHKEPSGTYMIPDNWTRAVGGIVWTSRQSSNWLLARVNNSADGTRGQTTGTYYGLRSPQILEPLIAGQEYTFTFKTRNSAGSNMNYNYTYIINDNVTSNQRINPVFIKNVDSSGQLWSVTFTPNSSDTGYILIGHSIPSGSSNGFFLKEPMLYKGNAISSWADSIQNKTDKDKIVSSINLDDSGVQISGKKIDLIGDVSMVSGEVKVRQLSATSGSNKLTMNGNTLTMSGNTGTLTMGNSGIVYRSSGGAMRYEMNENFVRSSTFGTTTANIYMAASAGYEVRFVDIRDVPGAGNVNDYRYIDARMARLYTSGIANNARYQTDLRLGADGVVAIMNNGLTTYGTLETAGLKADYLDLRAGNTGNLYIRPAGGSEVRITARGTTDQYRAIRASELMANSVYSNTSTNLYLRADDEVRVTAHGSTSNYRSIRASSFLPPSSEKYKTEITEWDYSVLDIIKDETKIYRYKLTGDNQPLFRHGLILERETPVEMKAGDGVDLYEMNSWTLKGVQELAHENDELKAKNEELENRLEKLEQILLK